KVKKVPQRTCVGCKQVKEKKELIRIVRTPEQKIIIDPTGKRSGRGAYICKNIVCLEAALAGRNLQQALKSDIPNEVIEELKRSLSGDNS
ncbi:MAG: RNase P modulator RnpM, partial [Fervidicoccus fontis]